jgi:hypothetical protein
MLSPKALISSDAEKAREAPNPAHWPSILKLLGTSTVTAHIYNFAMSFNGGRSCTTQIRPEGAREFLLGAHQHSSLRHLWPRIIPAEPFIEGLADLGGLESVSAQPDVVEPQRRKDVSEGGSSQGCYTRIRLGLQIRG